MPLPSTYELIKQHGISAKKSLGQHFLTNLSILEKIVSFAGDLKEKTILEIGPGPGGLTRAIIDHKPQNVYAVEKDETCIPILNEISELSPIPLKIIEKDALNFDESSLLSDKISKIHIVANLPYNIGTELLLKWLQYPENFGSITILLQKEVAERISAKPGGKSYGRLSVISQWLCEVEKGFDVPASAFSPPPKVTSSVIRLIPREYVIYPANRDALETLLRAAFGQRRKMLRSSLRNIINDMNVLTEYGIDPTTRPETLSIEDFCRLSYAIRTNSS